MLFNRLNELEDSLEDSPETNEILHAADYLPPHKSDGVVPYDAVIPLLGTPEGPGEWTESDVQRLLDQNGIMYDRITGVTENDSQVPANQLAFVSLVRR